MTVVQIKQYPRLLLLAVSTADILTCHSRNDRGVIDGVNQSPLITIPVLVLCTFAHLHTPA